MPVLRHMLPLLMSYAFLGNRSDLGLLSVSCEWAVINGTGSGKWSLFLYDR